MQTMNLEQLRATADAGGISNVTLKAKGSAFYLSIRTLKGGDALVVTAKGRDGNSPQPRKFVDPRKAMLLLRDLGIHEMHIDGAEWRPEDGHAERSRPDRSVAMKATHAAREHDAWFRAQVAEGIKEADDPKTEWVSHENAKAAWAKKRAALIKRAEKAKA